MIATLLAAALFASPTPGCSAPTEAMMSLDVRRFDQTMGEGWRRVGDRPGCETAAADLIAGYRRLHAATLVEGQVSDIRGLNWHEAQLRAAAGQSPQAIELFARARPDIDPARRTYTDATIAFLQHDRAKLEAARSDLLALPKPAWWDAAVAQAPLEHRPSWPEYLPEVDGFLACFDKPYAQAYAYACRPHTKP